MLRVSVAVMTLLELCCIASARVWDTSACEGAAAFSSNRWSEWTVADTIQVVRPPELPHFHDSCTGHRTAPVPMSGRACLADARCLSPLVFVLSCELSGVCQVSTQLASSSAYTSLNKRRPWSARSELLQQPAASATTIMGVANRQPSPEECEESWQHSPGLCAPPPVTGLR